MKRFHRTNKLRDKSKRRNANNIIRETLDNKDTVPALYKRTVRKHMGERLAWLFVGAMLALLLIAVAYFRLTTKDYSEYAVKVLNNYSYATEDLEAPRGVITDRNGNILAYSETYYLLILDPKNLLDKDYYETTVQALSKAIGIDREELDAVLKSNDANGSPIAEKSYYRYRESDGTTLFKVTEAQQAAFMEYKTSVNVSSKSKKAAALKKLYDFSDEEWKQYATKYPGYNSYQIQGISFEKQFKRIYPYGELACKVIGYYTGDASTGVENSYNEQLTGVAGKSYSYLNGDYNVSTQIVDEQEGNTVVTTIDINIQRIVEEAIGRYKNEYGAANIAAIVADPNTGEILAMADDKSFDLNNPSALPNGMTVAEFNALSEKKQAEVLEEIYGVQRLYCTTSPYEPGSIYKPITVSAALEENVVSPSDMYQCGGYTYVRGIKIRCHNREGCGEIDLSGTLENSCNVSLIQIVNRLGAANFDKYFRNFGYGTKTGIDLPGEESCAAVVFKDYTKETELELATSSFGQGFAVTMVQMEAAFSSLVNGGYYYTPHVMKEVVTSAGKLVESYDTTAKRTTVSSPTSEYIKKALFSVVVDGTGGFCNITGYDIGGKTGTAEQSPRNTNNWIASFISAAPIESPKLLVYVLVDRTDDMEWRESSKPAQDISREIWSKILPYYNVQSNLSEYDYLIPEESSAVISDKYDGSFVEETTEEETTTEETSENESSEDETKETSEGETEETSEGESTEETLEGETTEGNTEETTEGETTEGNTEETPTEGETSAEAETPEAGSEEVPAETDPATGFPIDPATGLPRHPDNGYLIVNGLWLDTEKNLYIYPETGQYYDPSVGLYIDIERQLYIDPATGQYLTMDTLTYVDPDTREPL